MNNLFGWSTMQPTKPATTSGNNFENIFKGVNNVSKVIVAVDGSGSTTFTTCGDSYDGMNFAQIYATALNTLHTDILTGMSNTYDIYGWSDEVKKFSQFDTDTYLNCIQIGVPFAQQISTLDGGTQPFKLLTFMNNVATVLVTDGDIPPEQVRRIQGNIKSVNSGPVYLVIVPHIGVYKNMYKQDVEANAMDNINISIPQAFAEKLACVLIWQHKKKTFEIIKELTAPWLASNINFEDLSSIFKVPMPLINSGSYLLRIGDSYKTFNIDEIISYVKDNAFGIAGGTALTTGSIENIINKLTEYQVSAAIIQQGNPTDKEKYNAMCLSLFNKGMCEHMNKYKEDTTETTDILELIKQSAKNTANKKRYESEYVQKYKDIFNKLMIDKTVGEISNVAAAKTLQTRDNVKSFQSMAVNDKLAEISGVLCNGECTICGTQTNIFKVVNIPSGFFTYVGTAINEREIKAKRGKTRMLKTLDVTAFKSCLSAHKPTLYCMDLCHGCANVSLSKAKRYDDPEYGITNIIPQNVVNGVVRNRLMLLPLIDPKNMNEFCNPNEPRLSFSRQTMRGFISKYTGLDVAGQDTMVALLMFLTSLANSKETATLVYASQVSILRGGSIDRYNDTIGRLLKPSITPISSSVLTQIMAIENVIELAEFNIIPESRKLLLLCLIERKITPLLHAKRYRDKSTAELKTLLTNRSEGADSKLVSAYDFNRDTLKDLLVDSETLDITQYNSNIAFNVQQRGIHLNQMIACENNLKEILSSKDSNTLATNLDLDPEYFKNIITKCNISDTQFIEMIPKFINDIVGANNDNEVIMNTIINYSKI
jgi:hypothetical protein